MLYRLLGGALAVIILGGAAQAQPGQDRHFLMDAIRGDNSEVMLGQLAAERGASPQVRDYGRMLHDDHARARDAALRVAAGMGVPNTREAMPEARQEARKLQRLTGPAFDREFVRYMVQDHRKDIAEFRREAHGRGPAAELAQATLPDLQKHLDTALRLSRG
ncbi:MAG: putative outer membrane protein [Phenylobacterium sp.]|nr:putative outer membrane protein [Phenylobacterium sp.]